MRKEFEAVLKFNEAFVKNKDYIPFETDVFPSKNMVILTCMDSRLTKLLPAALGIENGDVKMIKNAGGMITSATGSAMRSLIVAIYAFNIENVMVIAHDDCGMGKVDNSYLIENMYKRGISKDVIHQLDSLNFDTVKWLRGFDNVEDSVRESVSFIKNHPLIAKDVCILGFVINPQTGQLRKID